ncbi:respiratory nitrate reductase subunit gamma [Chloroflexota bacterium]
MESISTLQIITYALFLFSIVAFVMRLARIARMPVHLRWELYPLAGEKKRYWGGSYLEESEWWKKPPEEKSIFKEFRYIIEEILLFKEYFRRKRDYWYLVYPFHISVFLYVAFLAMLFIGAISGATGVVVSAETASVWGKIVYYITLLAGGIGFILGVISSVGLLIRRLTDGQLKPFTRRVDYINLLLVLAVFLTGLLAWVIFDPAFVASRAYIQGLVTFAPAGSISPTLALHIMLLLLLMAYIPFTNMMHFFAKTFTYHSVRWDDRPNLRGSKLERSIGPLLGRPVSWSASHIQDIKFWSDTATTVPQEVDAGHQPRVRKGASE